ncbi:MAG TPA: endo alpha-1,4 polygalactosaminidase [Actinocrinis sp.]|nr:endo alpha-1,4 polygalactosaminidase [Actinocrinis sp.]HZU55440.1 endo alpha-1,4 polygalactosaminidase [Actinocrinis sp.]
MPASSGSAPSAPGGSSSAVPAAVWHPKPGLTWQWQLSGKVDTSVDAQVYDIDGVENSAAVVATLHSAGRKVICYVNAGAYESFRADANRYPAAILGQSNGWTGERWLDVRQLSVLRPILADRFKACAQKGFDGIEADNVDGYRNTTGFPLTAADQLAFNRMLADLAHAQGLAIGLKNDLDQIPQLVSNFDFAVNEQCAEFSECDALKPFIAAGKAVFHVEYNLSLDEFCPTTTALGLSSMRKNLSLDAPRWPCPASSHG